MTSTIVIHPIIKALFTASTFLGIQNPSAKDWVPSAKTQQQFLHNYKTTWNELSSFSDQELKGFASRNINQLNELLRKEGFSIQLTENPYAIDQFGVVAILGILLNWKYKGTKTTIQSATTKQHYPAVSLENNDDEEAFCVFTSSVHSHPILKIATKNNDSAWITIADKKLDGFDLLDWIKKIRTYSLNKLHNYSSALFPMVNLNRQEDITWLIGMVINGYGISQALQQTKFKMNHEGAHVKSAVAICLEKLVMVDIKKEIIINRPFYIWIERPGVPEPYFAAYISEESWQNPEDLNL